MKELTSRSGGWVTAIVATLGMSVSYVDRQTLAAIAPSVTQAFHIDHAHFGWLVSAFSMAYLVGAPAAGYVVDRLGARSGFAIAVVAWSLVSGAHALVASFAGLFVLRILLGAAEAPSFPAAAQAVRRSLPAGSRGAAYGLLFTGSSLGAMIAAPLAVSLDGRYGFRFAFLVTALVGTVWIPAWLVVTRNTPREVAVERAPAPSFASVATSAPVLRALVAVVGSAPLIMFVLNWMSQYLVEQWKLPKNAVGTHLMLAPLLFDLGAVGFGYLTNRGTPGATRKGLILACGALGSLLAFAPLAPSPWIAVILFSVAACGGGGVYVIVTADMLGRVSPRATSLAGGMAAAAQSLAHIVASPLVGWAIDKHGYGVPTVVLGLAIVPSVVAFVFWPVRNAPAVA